MRIETGLGPACSFPLLSMLTLLSVELAGALALAPALPPNAPQEAAALASTTAPSIRLGKPQLLMVGDRPLVTEPPGFAAPAWHDMDGDGRGDLVVGQFMNGQVQVFRGTAEGFEAGTWLEAGGQIAQVPGVW